MKIKVLDEEQMQFQRKVILEEYVYGSEESSVIHSSCHRELQNKRSNEKSKD